MKISSSGSGTKDGDVNLTKASLTQLKDLLERQENLLHNKIFISKLPDKGTRIINFRDKIQLEIKRRDIVDDAAEQLAKISLQSVPNDLEWKKSSVAKNHQADDDDSDDDPDPLRLLATHSGTQRSFIRRKEEGATSLVTAKDIQEARAIQYSEKMCKKYDERETRERFKPCMPKHVELAKTGYRSSSENVQKKLGKSWEVTAATPPVPVHDSVQAISLADSLELQRTQAEKLKEIQLKDAMARLRDPNTLRFGTTIPRSNLMAYRDPSSLFDGTPVRESQSCDVMDECDDIERGGAVFYNIVDDVGNGNS